MPKAIIDDSKHPFPVGGVCHCSKLGCEVKVTEDDRASGLQGVRSGNYGSTARVWLVPCACNVSGNPDGAWIRFWQNDLRGSHVYSSELVRELMSNPINNGQAPQSCRTIQQKPSVDRTNKNVMIISADDYKPGQFPKLDELTIYLKSQDIITHVFTPIPGRSTIEQFKNMVSDDNIGTILLFVTPNWRSDFQITKLVGCFMQLPRSIVVLPVLLPDSDSQSLGLFLRGIQPVDCKGGWDFGRMVWGITGKRPSH